MIGAIGSAGGRQGTPSGGTTASTEAALGTARAQLEDWITCPSRVTPEGKAKIKEFTEKVQNLQHRLEQTQQGAATKAPRAGLSVASSLRAATTPAEGVGRQAGSALGSFVDVYA